MCNDKFKGLTIGRIVWVYNSLLRERRPAIVTKVIDKSLGIINANQFLTHNDFPGIEINDKGEVGTYSYSEKDESMTWCWPKRED